MVRDDASVMLEEVLSEADVEEADDVEETDNVVDVGWSAVLSVKPLDRLPLLAVAEAL